MVTCKTTCHVLPAFKQYTVLCHLVQLYSRSSAYKGVTDSLTDRTKTTCLPNKVGQTVGQTVWQTGQKQHVSPTKWDRHKYQVVVTSSRKENIQSFYIINTIVLKLTKKRKIWNYVQLYATPTIYHTHIYMFFDK